jgi:hypothetical protein
MRRSAEQRDTNGVLEILDRRRHGRLGDRKIDRGIGDLAMLGGRNEIAKLSETERHVGFPYWII